MPCPFLGREHGIFFERGGVCIIASAREEKQWISARKYPAANAAGYLCICSQSLNLLVVFCRSVASVASDCEAEAISSLEADCDSDEEEMFCMFSAVAWLIS